MQHSKAVKGFCRKFILPFLYFLLPSFLASWYSATKWVEGKIHQVSSPFCTCLIYRWIICVGHVVFWLSFVSYPRYNKLGGGGSRRTSRIVRSHVKESSYLKCYSSEPWLIQCASLNGTTPTIWISRPTFSRFICAQQRRLLRKN